MKKINCILLVDDDPITNFLNEELITDLEVAEHVHVALNGREALDYIQLKGKFADATKKTHPRPNLIFLDINMPLMDGFEFLKHYDKLPKVRKAEVVIVFLTTSDAPKDQLEGISNELIHDFLQKPLREEALKQIRDDYFALVGAAQ